MSKQQTTLVTFDFTKTVTHRGKVSKLEISDFSIGDDARKIPGPHATKNVLTNKG